MRLLTSLICLAIAASAQAGEPLKGADVEATLNDMTAYYLPLSATSARQYFNKNGETIYIDAAGAKTIGEWLVRGDGYCSVWPPSEHYVCYPLEKGVSADGKLTYTFVSGSGGPRYESVLVKGNVVDKPWE
jgi:hypothetical protein